MKCKCGRKMDVSFEGNGIQYPVFSCSEHGVEKNHWKEWWDNYSTRGLKKEFWNNKKDLPSCVVSYFCNMFYEFYGYGYTLDYTNPIPYKNKEFTMARRIISMFGEDYLQIPNYIKWVFHKRVKTRKYPLNSLGFFASSKFVNEYKAARARAIKPKRSSKIPKEFMEWCNNNYKETTNYHELKNLNDLNILIGLSNDKENIDEINIIKEARKRGIVPEFGYIQLEE